MKLSDEFDSKEDNNRLPLMYMVIGMITFLAFVFVLVLGMNSKNTPKVIPQNPSIETENPKEDDVLAQLGIGESTLTSDQLDFWNMYKEDRTQLGQQISANTLTKDELYEKNAQKLIEEELQKEAEADLSEGGTKTMVVRPDGSEQWIMINSYLPQNNYEEIGFVYEEPIMRYFQDGAKHSFLGTTLKADDGEIDFEALRKAGVEFVMIRIGYRGYESGELNLDGKYYENVQKADDANLKVGVYFESAAISEQEGLEEAEYVITHLAEMHITYPVVFRMEMDPNQKARMDSLTKVEISKITNSFCDRVAESGLRPMVFGTKYWLLRKMDLSLMKDYDFWLSQEGEKPDYPYAFSMWQYNNAKKIDGISTDIPLSISMKDYSKR